MKKKISLSLLLSLLLVLLAVPAHASQYPAVYDGSALLPADAVQLLEAQAENVRVLYGVDLHVDIVQDLNGYSPDEYAQLLYVSGGYGFAESFAAPSGLSMLLYLPAAADGGVTFGGYAFCTGGLAAQVFTDDALQDMQPLLEISLNEAAFAGDAQADAAAAAAAAQSFFSQADAALMVHGGSLQSAALPTSYVDDRAYLLDAQEIAHLNEWGLQLAAQYGCGVYAVTVDDMAALGFDDSFYCAIELYESGALGIGEGRNGILLLLSMQQRDYAIAVYGDIASAAFTDYGTELLSYEFLDDFADDYWYGGFYDYYSFCEYLLDCHAAGTPADYSDDYYGDDYYYDDGQSDGTDTEAVLILLGLLVGFPCVVALIVCLLFRAQLKSARRQTRAAQYVPEGGVHITRQWDRFTHRTETRHKIESSSSGGGSRSSGSSRSSGGFSGRSGKF